jgi:hypothetical protein
MSDNTTLNSGAGGDTLRTEDVGAGVKIPVSKIHNGASGVDGGPITNSNPLATQTQSGSLTSLLVGGNATPVSFSNPFPVSGALGVLVGGVAASPANPVPVSGGVGVLVAGAQASSANPLPTRSQSGSLVSILLGSGLAPVAVGNPLPITGSIGITNAGVNVSRANSLAVEQTSEASGQILSGTTVRVVNYLATDVAASGSTQLIAPQGAGNMIRILSMFAMASGTLIAKLLSTGSAGTITNLSGYIPLTANGGYVLPHNPHGWFQTKINEGFNIAVNTPVGGSVNVGLNLTWVLA